MLKSDKMFGFDLNSEYFFPKISDPLYPAIVGDAVECPDETTCFIWAAVYHNISTITTDFDIEIYRSRENWTDKNNRHLLYEMDGRVVRTVDFAIAVRMEVCYLNL